MKLRKELKQVVLDKLSALITEANGLEQKRFSTAFELEQIKSRIKEITTIMNQAEKDFGLTFTDKHEMKKQENFYIRFGLVDPDGKAERR